MSPDRAQPMSEEAVRRALQEVFEVARDAVAPAPGADAESLRAAYLDLLKLALCDLAGTTTTSVERFPEGIASHELESVWLKLRAVGRDWPMHGLTMVGLTRLDDLQACIEDVVRAGLDGDVVEAGSWRGGASIFARATLNTLGDSGRAVVVADSFQGFPPGGEEAELALVDYLSVPLEEVQANFARFGLTDGVEFVPGYFEQTMPGLRGRRWSLIRLDADSYEATRAALTALYPGLQQGGWVIIDDYDSFAQCGRAVDEFRSEHGIAEPLEQVDWTCRRWRRTDAPAAPAAAAPPARAPGRPPAAPARTRARIPSRGELRLLQEVTTLRSASVRARIRRLFGSR